MNGCMKRFTLGVLALLLTLQGAAAATLTITKPWTAVRARPQADAPVLALAFGNDALPLVQRSGAWLAVRLPGGRLGWVPATDAAPQAASAAPANADAAADAAAVAPGGT
jgi:hypothetical protein